MWETVPFNIPLLIPERIKCKEFRLTRGIYGGPVCYYMDIVKDPLYVKTRNTQIIIIFISSSLAREAEY